VGDEGAAAGDCGSDGGRGGGHVERPGTSCNGCGSVLWDGVWGGARADRREESGGYTRCSRRYCRGNRRVRARVRVGRGWIWEVEVEGVVVEEGGVFDQRRERVLEGEQGIGEMVKGLAYTVGVRDGEENVVAAVVVYSGGEVESPSPMVCS
jgi:hypothetical protein